MASVEGGALKYVEKSPVFLEKNNKFNGTTNTAIYGPNYAAYPVKMQMKILEPLGDDINLAKMSKIRFFSRILFVFFVK